MIGSPQFVRERSPDPQRLEPRELTPVHQRTSRRVRGDPPEFGPLPVAAAVRATVTSDGATMTSAVASSQLIVYPPRTPESFHGDTFEDVEDWLEQFERVADFNGWDETRKLCNVYFALEESARTWYVNHEATLSSWEEFRRQLLATYASTDRREKAEHALQARNQRTNESVGMYIEDMSRLFTRADPNMIEEKKLRHLMRGVKQELFAGLVRNPPHSVAEFRTEATTIEKALQQRAHPYNRDVTSAPADILSAGPGSNTEALRELVRSIVKEELRKLQLPEATPTVSTLAAVIRDEVRHAIVQPGLTTTLDAMLPVDDENNNPYDVDDFLQRAEEARQLARFRIRQQQRRDASYYNLRRREVQYHPDDKVWIFPSNFFSFLYISIVSLDTLRNLAAPPQSPSEVLCLV
ncbi:uncharacterized protein LOC142561134 [Dermacentor variabilis]|uniref:uncharacterized protein LOC142561134 n=1 Tax=Dermacentor variabilis TaxID=34621 RepID=UPI003F5BD857